MGLKPEADAQPEVDAQPEASKPSAATEPAPATKPAPRTEAAPTTGEAALESEEPTARPLPSLGRAPGSIRPTDSFARAGRKAMWLHVSRMFAREEALRDPAETDALKRYRVATRRLRAALRIFRDAYPPRESKPLRNALALLADSLGVVRDLDVRIEALDQWAAEQGNGAPKDIAPLREAWAAQRRAAAGALIRQLETKRHARLLDDLAAFVTADDSLLSSPTEGPPRTIADRAASSVWAAYEQVRAYATVVRWADLEALHSLRIEAKRLRYVLEFLGDVLGPERDAVIERLVALQDQLGALNDATIAVGAVRTFLGERHSTLRPAERSIVERYLVEREREAGRLRRGLGRVWRPVVGVTFARRLGRAVVIRTVPRTATAVARAKVAARARVAARANVGTEVEAPAPRGDAAAT
jgi:CHAD domain-containing protein